MPPAAQKRRKKTSAGKAAPDQERTALLHFIAAASSGALMGLSAPGFDQWYLAWVGLVPLLLLVAGSNGPGQAFWRGLVWGFAYNLVYLNWYLGLHPLNWLGFPPWQSAALAAAAWLTVSLHQGLIVGLFAGALRFLPLTGGFLPRRVEERWHLPSLIVVPLVWVLVLNKLGNAHDLLGVPWSMIEYSQYRQLPILQITAWVGGIGLSLLMVLVNASVAGLVSTATRKFGWQPLAAPTTGDAVRHLLTACLLVALVSCWGLATLSRASASADVPVTVLQGNINIDMQKTERRYTLDELLDRNVSLAQKASPGLCIWTENALPAYLRQESSAQKTLSALARARALDLVIGCLDRDEQERPFNSAFGVKSDGTLLPVAYHKRYLVPFGEYTPYLVQYMPEWIRRLTNTPAGGGFAAGDRPVLLDFSGHKVAPLICFETVSPEIVADSVRSGGNIVVNLTDLAWFHDSMIGDQMLAFAVLRAVENNRYFVFAANSGPSAIIEPTGRISARSEKARTLALSGRTAFISRLTPFTFWFR